MKTELSRSNYLTNNPNFAESMEKLKEIKRRVDEMGMNFTNKAFDNIVHEVMFAKQIEVVRKKKEEKEQRKLVLKYDYFK